jgi:hypothetical protein
MGVGYIFIYISRTKPPGALILCRVMNRYLVYPIDIMAWACPGVPYTICMLEIEKCTWRGTPMHGEIKGCR